MRAAWRWPGLLAIMLVLAACGGRHATRPSAGAIRAKVHELLDLMEIGELAQQLVGDGQRGFDGRRDGF